MAVKIGNSRGNDIDGTNGNDRLFGRGGNDELDGRRGLDKLFGNGGNDDLDGGAADDSLYGGKGNDELDGGAGNDLLKGGKGRDELDGDHGDDVLVGGKGADRFIFDENSGSDTIKDFKPGQDRIAIDIDVLVDFGNLDISENAEGYAVIDFGSGNSVVIKGVSENDLDVSDFIFDT
jgi:Ca2+-binding RTX toxin-like protein